VISAAGTRHLLRLAFRRDRWVLLWILYLGVLPVTYASSFAALYKTTAERADFAHQSASNGTFVALYGPLSGSSIGDLVTWRTYFLLVIVGLASLLMVIRHTRVEEEQGRAELVESGVVGRQARVIAALIETGIANLALCAFIALTLIAKGLPAAGSIALGFEFLCVGVIFAAVGAVTAQLATFASRARGLAIVVLAAAYTLRIIGDLRDRSHDSLSWLSWISPIGLAQHIHPYTSNQWWVVALCIALAVLVGVVALVLSERRDLGSGILQPRPGPAVAAPQLRNPLALAWRLQRGLLFAWLTGMALIGIVLGSVANSAGGLLGDSNSAHDIVTRLGGQNSLVDAYLAAVMGIISLIISAYAIQSVLIVRSEETNGRAEPLLATAVSRTQWAGSHLFFAFTGPALVLLATSLVAGVTYGSNSGHLSHDTNRVLVAALAQLPAIWVLTTVAFVFVGALPRLSFMAWVALIACLLVTMVGTAMQLSQWLLDISPFTHIPKLPGGDFSITPLLVLTAAALAFGAIGLIGIRNRSIPQ
jgi:ABC-2 type transport system permease protein